MSSFSLPTHLGIYQTGELWGFVLFCFFTQAHYWNSLDLMVKHLNNLNLTYLIKSYKDLCLILFLEVPNTSIFCISIEYFHEKFLILMFQDLLSHSTPCISMFASSKLSQMLFQINIWLSFHLTILLSCINLCL